MFNFIKRFKKKSADKQQKETINSIYEKIKEVLQEDGKLPVRFQLEELDDNYEGIRFAPGALEGILGHHSLGKGSDSSTVLQFIKERISNIPENVLMEYEEKYGELEASSIRDDLLQSIINDIDSISAELLYRLAYTFIIKGTKENTVKMGLSLMAIFNNNDKPKIKEILLQLSAWEGFTDYVIINIGDWEDKNEALFKIAKRTRGWGKINAVEELEVETEEIKEWLLCYGCENSIVDSYLGIVCAEKCDLYNVLKSRQLNQEEFKGAGIIISALFDEGPCLGISVLDNAEELLLLYMEQIKIETIDVKLLNLLNDIMNYYTGIRNENEDTQWTDLGLNKCKEIFETANIQSIIMQDLQELTWYAVAAAENFSVDISNELYSLVEKDFNKYINSTYYFFKHNVKVKELVDLCEKKLEYNKVATGMGKLMGFRGIDHWSIDLIVQYLDEYPLLGEKLILASINSPIIRYRNMAAKAIEGWQEKLQKPIQIISQDLYKAIVSVSNEECDEGLQKRWRKML